MRNYAGLRCVSSALLLVATIAGCTTANSGGKALPDFMRTGISGQALRQPATAHDLNADPHVIEINLTAQVSQYEFIEGHPSEVWTYNGQLPGPQIEAEVGDELIVHFHNELPEETSIHWHGIRLPQAMDGSHASQSPVPSGGSFEYHFTLPDAGLYWYHPHVSADDQFSRGLYGSILVRDPADPLAALPSRVLVLSDIELNADGQVMSASTREHTEVEHSIGTTGNTLLVNGQIQPSLSLAAGSRERWYVLNAAAARVFKLELEGSSLTLVGTDGGLIESPVELPDIVMGPGERNEFTVNAGAEGSSTRLLSRSYTQLLFVSGYTPDPDATLMDVVFAAPAATPPAGLPAHLASLPQPGEPVTTRSFQLTSQVPPDMHMSMAMEGGHHGSDGAMFRINGAAFPDVPVFTSKLGTTEIWRVNNHTNMDHPFHVHGFRFQVLSIDGVPYPYRAWKDTVELPGTALGNQWYELAVVFDGYPGEWVYHCHILHHQELGMMGDFMVEQ